MITCSAGYPHNDKKEETDIDNRTLVKLTASEDSISIRTISRRHKSPHSFVILREEFRSIYTGGCTVTDIHSFADLRLDRLGRTVRVRLCWLNLRCDDTLNGMEEWLWLPADPLLDFVEQSAKPDGPKEWAALSILPHTGPKLVFDDLENLRNVLQVPTLRRKLVRFLRDNFHWPYSDAVLFQNDFDPYSFFFREISGGRPGICGGLILHRTDSWESAYYAIHT